MKIKSLLLITILLLFSPIGIAQCDTFRARVLDVYDGDTFNADASLGLGLTLKIRVRIYGINSPEMTGTSKLKATASRDSLRSLISDRDITIKYRGKDKYGRFVANVYVDTIDVSRWMLKRKLAVRFMDVDSSYVFKD
jgi:micrococcal nuclease